MVYFPIEQENASKPMGRTWEIDTHSLYTLYFVTWETHKVSHQFPIALEKTAKSIEWGRPGIGCPYLFRKWVLFPIGFSSCGILHQMRNACVFSSISHSMRPSNGKSLRNWFPRKPFKTHCVWRTWEIGILTFPIAWVLFSY